jgi:hypothetical protein
MDVVQEVSVSDAMDVFVENSFNPYLDGCGSGSRIIP